MNMIFKLFSAGALMFLGVACTSCEKENENNKESDIPMEQVSYKASNEIIVNPERGFYKATSCEMGTSGALSVSTLKNYRANGYSLIFRYFYLKNFRDKALTDEALQFFDKDMAAMREAGVKCVLRFAYTSSETEPGCTAVYYSNTYRPIETLFGKERRCNSRLASGVYRFLGRVVLYDQ